MPEQRPSLEIPYIGEISKFLQPNLLNFSEFVAKILIPTKITFSDKILWKENKNKILDYFFTFWKWPKYHVVKKNITLSVSVFKEIRFLSIILLVDSEKKRILPFIDTQMSDCNLFIKDHYKVEIKA